MNVLGIDTSAKTCSAAVFQDETCLSSRLIGEGLTHSQTLLPLIKELLCESKIALSEIDLIAITAGPGSFTGLRIGISTVKGLAFPDDIACIGVSTLAACAENCSAYEGYVICPLMDARRGEFYNALFLIRDGLPCRMTDDRAISGEALREELKDQEKLVLIGDGAEKFASLFPEFLPFLSPSDIRFQSGKGAALLGKREFNKDLKYSAKHLAPVYLRLPQAEREWQAKNIKSSEV